MKAELCEQKSKVWFILTSDCTREKPAASCSSPGGLWGLAAGSLQGRDALGWQCQFQFGSGTPVPLCPWCFGWDEVRAEIIVTHGLCKPWGCLGANPRGGWC